MGSLTTLVSLLLCVAVCHVTCQGRVWFPDQQDNNNQHGTAGDNRQAVMVESVQQRIAQAQDGQRTGRHGFASQNQNVQWKSQQNNKNALRRRGDQETSQTYQQPAQWNQQRPVQSNQWSDQREGTNGQWKNFPVAVKNIYPNPATHRVNVKPLRPHRVNPTTGTKTRITDEEQEFDDYWLEDDLKDSEQEAAAVTTTTTTMAPRTTTRRTTTRRTTPRTMRTTPRTIRTTPRTVRTTPTWTPPPTTPSERANEIVDAAGQPSGPSRCVWAIISCCKPTATTSQIRYSCFEAVGCHGAFWDTNPCSKQMMAAALQATANFYKIPPKEDDE